MRLLEESFCIQSEPFTNRQVGERILALAELFSRIQNELGDVVGLWGELFLIQNARDWANAASHWCTHRKSKYDFVTEDFAVECKTTLRPQRQHRFAIDQLRPNGSFEVYVASLLLTETHAGRTVSELVDEIYEQLSDDDLRDSFFKQCLSKGGKDLYRSSLRLHPLPQGNSLAMYQASDIPVPHVDQSDPISNLRFDVDLSLLSEVSTEVRDTVLAFS